MFDLSDHVALITGGNGGLGLAMARGIVKAGGSVAIWGRNADKNAAAVAELTAMGGTTAAFACDVTDRASCETAFAGTLDRFGKIDSCFANAGGSGVRGPFHRLTEQDWATTNALNVDSVITSFQLAITHWLERKSGGKLIVTSSIAGLMGVPQSGGYCMTKAAVQGLIRSNMGVRAFRPTPSCPVLSKPKCRSTPPNIFRTDASAAPHPARLASWRIWRGSPFISRRAKAAS